MCRYVPAYVCVCVYMCVCAEVSVCVREGTVWMACKRLCVFVFACVCVGAEVSGSVSEQDSM